MQGELLVLAAQQPQARADLQIMRRPEPQFKFGTVHTGFGRVNGMKAGAGTARKQESIEELLVAIIIME